MRGSLVYHHTPLTQFLEQTPWVVLEYATQDRKRSVATLFRTSSLENPIFHFIPRGLDISANYKVTFENLGETLERSGFELMQDGISVRLEGAGTSEMLIFESVDANVARRG